VTTRLLLLCFHFVAIARPFYVVITRLSFCYIGDDDDDDSLIVCDPICYIGIARPFYLILFYECSIVFSFVEISLTHCIVAGTVSDSLASCGDPRGKGNRV